MRISRWMVNRSAVAAWFSDARPFGPAVIAAVLGLGLSTFVWFAVASWEDRLAKEAFIESASDQSDILQTGVDEYLHKLIALRAFFNGSQQGVTRNEFNIFTRDLLDERKAILSFSWIPRVTREERAQHELEGLRDGIAGYEIKTVGPDGRMNRAPERDRYFPVFYSKEPLTARVYGINLQDGGFVSGHSTAHETATNLQRRVISACKAAPVIKTVSSSYCRCTGRIIPITRSMSGGAILWASCRAFPVQRHD